MRGCQKNKQKTDMDHPGGRAGHTSPGRAPCAVVCSREDGVCLDATRDLQQTLCLSLFFFVNLPKLAEKREMLERLQDHSNAL